MLILLIMKSYNLFSAQQQNNQPHIWSIGDAGGYMGLLIGASCFTLCEVLDLFLYNSFLKMITKYKRRRVSPGINMDTGKTTFDGMNMNDSHFQAKCYVDTLTKIVEWSKYSLIDLRPEPKVHACLKKPFVGTWCVFIHLLYTVLLRIIAVHAICNEKKITTWIDDAC